MALLQAATETGLCDFDTAPGYGGGFAPALLARLAALSPGSIHASTKIGGWQERRWRNLAKRLLRARNVAQVLAPQAPPASAAMRGTPAWWGSDDMLRHMDFAFGQLSNCVLDACFLHAPPVLLDSRTLESLARVAVERGALQLGISSPRNRDLETYSMDPRSPLRCVQLHLDQWLRAAPSTQEWLLQRGPWIHGIYSPGPDSRLPDLASREAAAKELCRSAPSARLVVGVRSMTSLRRLAAFAQAIAA